jgi:hypothetical protein
MTIIEERLRTIERDWRLLHEQNEQLSALLAALQVIRDEERIDSDARADAMSNALRAVLLFHDGRYWSAEVAQEWKRLTGSDEATPVVLCQRARDALGVEPGGAGAICDECAQGAHAGCSDPEACLCAARLARQHLP